VRRALQATRAQRVVLAYLGNKEQLDALVSRVLLAILDRLDSQDVLETLALLDREVILVRQAVLVYRVQRVPLESQEIQADRGQLDLSALQAIKVILERLVILAFSDNKELVVNPVSHYCIEFTMLND